MTTDRAQVPGEHVRPIIGPVDKARSYKSSHGALALTSCAIRVEDNVVNLIFNSAQYFSGIDNEEWEWEWEQDPPNP